ncbi:hypothetical protein B1A99_03720 [Cohnella sp. CIP 111063]|uniref:cache domain-containing sensor histidine kinase n=1 Tax=unclassified Cohnella TaxID=2636738 RepID=UPI000B8C4AF7|nr:MULTISPECIES: sensor histidine kinase [unclassified Cohnella]OXS61730.1 hypothetical protein B1A99_03720 [Cohnella sp. CIP 111063]PRX74163.1 two-component system sensor histidine kinase YesM [Cohnella sp. SGD-V74]
MADIRFSIRSKLIALLLLATVVPFGVAIVFNYQLTSRSVAEQTLQENINLLSEGHRNIDAYLKRIDQLGLSLYTNAAANNLFRREMSRDDTLSAGVKDILLTVIRSSPNIQRVELYMRRSGLTFVLTPSLWRQYTQEGDAEDGYARALENPYRGHFALERPEGRQFTYRRAFVDIPGDDVLGYLTITIDAKEIGELVRDLYVPGKSEFLLLNPEGEALFRSSDTGEMPSSADWLDRIRREDRPSGHWSWEEGGFRGIMVYNRLQQTNEGWLLVKQIPYDTLNRNAREIVKMNLWIGGLALVLAVAATLLVSFKITRPLQVLVRNIRSIKKGHMQVDFDRLGNDEIGIVGDQFKSMVETIRSLMIKEYNLEIQNKTQQLNTLQAQLNPHFLNNALQSTAALAYENEDFEVYRLIRSLSKMMRYSMDFEEESVPLVKEIEHVQAYLELQKHRFEERLSVEIEADRHNDGWFVPKMTIQPLVENYFKHAFDRQSGNGRLAIRVEKVEAAEGPRLRIVVEDNGPGMDEAEMASVTQAVHRPPDQHESYGKVGLVNLFRRIRLYYGDSAETKMENGEGGGFRVTLLLPERMEERDSSLLFGIGEERT